MPRGKHPENVSPYTGLRVSVCKITYTQEGEKLPTGGGEWPTFRTAHGTPPLKCWSGLVCNVRSNISVCGCWLILVGTPPLFLCADNIDAKQSPVVCKTAFSCDTY